VKRCVPACVWLGGGGGAGVAGAACLKGHVLACVCGWGRGGGGCLCVKGCVPACCVWLWGGVCVWTCREIGKLNRAALKAALVGDNQVPHLLIERFDLCLLLAPFPGLWTRGCVRTGWAQGFIPGLRGGGGG
jgi:hypothetical protein